MKLEATFYMTTKTLPEELKKYEGKILYNEEITKMFQIFHGKDILVTIEAKNVRP